MNIRLITYNIHRAIGLDRRFRLDRITRILKDHDADIVLLQEVDDGVPRSRNLDMARELAGNLGYNHFAFGRNVSLRKGRYGNATLSRFPITRERNIDLTLHGKKRRGCQHTSIALDSDTRSSQQIEVFNLHLGLGTLERQRQIEVLARSRELSTIDSRTPCLLGGDFNDWRSVLSETIVEQLGFDCATEKTSHSKTRGLATYPSFSPRGPLDRFYYRGGLQLLSVMRCRHHSARIASDHLPIIAEFDMPGEPGNNGQEIFD